MVSNVSEKIYASIFRIKVNKVYENGKAIGSGKGTLDEQYFSVSLYPFRSSSMKMETENNSKT
jgi:hypothetical protein